MLFLSLIILQFKTLYSYNQIHPIMDHIITIEQITDLDTITLQEKLQQLQTVYQSPDIQLITMLKLQLEERYKVEEFALMLINDQYKCITDKEVKFQKPIYQQQKSQLVIETSKKRNSNVSQLLKRSLVPSTSIIGKPALSNYRYVPKKQLQSSNRMKSFSKKQKQSNKKINYSGKVQSKTSVKFATIGLPPIINKKSNAIKEELQKQDGNTERKSTNPSQISQQNKQSQEISCVAGYSELKCRKQSGNKLSIKFIENDIYEEKRLQECQNLGQIQKEMQQQKIHQGQTDPHPIPQVLDDAPSQICYQSLQSLTNSPIQSQKLEINKHCLKQQDLPPQIKLQEQCSQQLSSLKFQGAESKESPNNQTNRYQKSYSVNVLKPLPFCDEPLNQNYGLQILDCRIEIPDPMRQRQTQNSNSKKNEDSQKIFLKPNRKVDRAIIPETKTVFKYHQIIPNFAKLFPHSNNLITSLRDIEQELSKHISKDVIRNSLNDEYLRIRESELLCQTVTECQKAKKYQNLFNISLDKFLSRGSKMLARINKESTAPSDHQALLYRVVRQKQDVYDIVNNSFHRTQNWFQLPHGMDLKISWNLLWTWSRPQIDIKSLCYFQKVNHFFGNKQIARKDLLKKNIEKIKKLGKNAHRQFDIIPETFYLPGENMQFIRKFRQYGAKGDLNYWILKPVGMSRGRGIELINRIEDIVFNQPIVLQKYVLDPLLLDGYKFDMRIYVLVTSINPLEAYVYKEGFARISTEKYSLEEDKLADKFIHLTNFSVQKDNIDEKTTKLKKKSFEEQVGGCKITLKMLKDKLIAQKHDWSTIQSQIHAIVIKSLISAMKAIDPNPNCFQLFGYDIMIDQSLKCWLIQINSSPSLEKEFLIDEVLKQQLVDDVVQLVNPIAYDRVRLLEVVRRRRKQLEGHKSHIKTSNNSNQQLNNDIEYILHGKPIPKYGERGEHPNFIRIAPSKMYNSILKIVQNYKRQSIENQY